MEAISFFAADIGIVLIVLLSFIIGWARGATKEVLSVLSWVGGIYLTIFLFPYTKDIARSYISHGLIADFATYCLLFIIFLTILSVLNYFCSNFVKKSILNRTDKALGGMFGILRGIVILAVIDLIATQCFNEAPKWLANSKLRPAVTNISNLIILVLPESVQDTVLSHMSIVKKQSILDFVRDDIVKNAKLSPLDFPAQNKVPAQISSKNELDNASHESDEEEIINETESIQSVGGQTAEELATLKPKKKTVNANGEEKTNIKRSKKERSDMDRVLDQYNNIDDETKSDEET